MILQRVAVRHFKGIEQAAYDDLSERLNLFRGPNEAGKTTIVEALHFGLFEQAAGVAQHKRDLETWGRAEAPEVTIDLVDGDGEPWRVHKRFLHVPSTELSGRNVVLKGAAAERRLREMLGTRPGNRHGVRPGDLGIWPLLWVRQGEAGAAIKDVLTPDARSTLQHTLSARTGALVAGQDARRVLTRLDALVDDHLTPTGRAKGPLGDAEQAVVDARLARDDAHDALQAARRAREAVRELRQRLDDLDRRVAAQAAVAARAAQAQDQGRTTAATVGDAAARVQDAERALADLNDRMRAVSQARQGLDTQQERLVQAEAQARAAAARLAQTEALAQQARAAVMSAAEALTHARDVARRSAAQAGAIARRDRREQLHARIVEARDVESALRRADEEARALPSDRDLAALESAQARVDEALAARRPVVLTLTDAAGQQHTAALSPGATAEIGGWTVAVAEPDGEDDPVASARRDLRSRLDALGLPDVAAVRVARARRHALDAERTRLATRLGVLAPDGRVPLELALDALSHEDAGIDEDLPDVEAAEAAREAAERGLDEAQRAREAASARVHAARVAQADAEQAARHARDAMGRHEAVLHALGDLAVLETRQGEARERLRAARADHEAAVSADEEAHRHARRAADEATAHDRLIARREEARAQLASQQSALARARAEGPWSRWRAAERRLRDAEDHLARLSSRIHAAARARDALRRAWTARQAELAGPVRRLVLRDLPALFPGSEPALDEDGDLVGLRTGDVVETFPSLSAGSREQLGVLLRLALARVLGEGRRLPVLLDDALVHSDPVRRARVVELLRRAADDVQILVFTSHDDDFDRLAADRVYEVRGRPARGVGA